jgi:uncharacterized SAM-binding protein YcdF (DUF218 family)
MIFFLSKILLFLIKPIVWVFVILIFAIKTKDQKKRKKRLWTSIIVLFFFSNNFLASEILSYYEAPYPTPQKYDVGIVLGGFSNLSKRNNQIEFGLSGDRLFQAISLYKKGDIKKIMVSGGSANLLDTTIKEADLAVNYLKLIGIPDSSILIENASRNTIENAINSLAIVKKYKPDAKILIITSAWHIPRARLIFDRLYNNKLAYYPTNYISNRDYDIRNFIIPDPLALYSWELMIKEWVGLIVDRIRAAGGKTS